jgi:hypothetical protein
MLGRVLLMPDYAADADNVVTRSKNGKKKSTQANPSRRFAFVLPFPTLAHGDFLC